jgi:hypothetical protein
MTSRATATKQDEASTLNVFCAQEDEAWRVHINPTWIPDYLALSFDRHGEAFGPARLRRSRPAHAPSRRRIRTARIHLGRRRAHCQRPSRSRAGGMALDGVRERDAPGYWGVTVARQMCYSASMRAGRTKTTSFSLDDATLQNLKALAARRHNGNVSALLAEVAMREAKFAAAEAYFEKYGIPPLTAEAIERIEAEWQGRAPAKRRRRAA